MKNLFQHLKTLHYRHRTALVVGIFAVIASIAINYALIGTSAQYIYDKHSERSLTPGEINTAIVLGGGIKDGKPRPILKGRLDTAAELLETGTVKKLLLSGDNRFDGYDEPGVMKNYLVGEKGIDESLLALDQAGRSTYETCERAVKIFGIEKTILVSEATHLPRAIYLCRSFGIEAYGAKSEGEATKGLRIGQRWREVLARTKATLNVYIIGENTVLGDKLPLE